MTALHHQEPLFSANSVFKSHSLETLPLLGDSACHKFVLFFFFSAWRLSFRNVPIWGRNVKREGFALPPGEWQISKAMLHTMNNNWWWSKKNSEWLIYLKLHLMGFCASVQGFQHFVIFWSDWLKNILHDTQYELQQVLCFQETTLHGYKYLARGGICTFIWL